MDNSIPKKKAEKVGDLISEFLTVTGLSSTVNTRIIFETWDEASGAAEWTIKRFYSDGKLYITLGSSVVRSQLHFQKKGLVEKMNSMLLENELFTVEDKKVSLIKELILK